MEEAGHAAVQGWTVGQPHTRVDATRRAAGGGSAPARPPGRPPPTRPAGAARTSKGSWWKDVTLRSSPIHRLTASGRPPAGGRVGWVGGEGDGEGRAFDTVIDACTAAAGPNRL